MKGNFVAKHAHKYNKCVAHKDKTKFDRNQLILPAKLVELEDGDKTLVILPLTDLPTDA